MYRLGINKIKSRIKVLRQKKDKVEKDVSLFSKGLISSCEI